MCEADGAAFLTPSPGPSQRGVKDGSSPHGASKVGRVAEVGKLNKWYHAILNDSLRAEKRGRPLRKPKIVQRLSLRRTDITFKNI
ncbi:hypothetical protein E2C01_022242 [Portunus trituberculatus]|uniref:Uncharacterized protein n=1 Tax=Portunus trituberculatus TaxID=210409 RepID=A0A5B7E745_PORTR|nr:hypothetical protein [Portunus trituberculatus]